MAASAEAIHALANEICVAASTLHGAGVDAATLTAANAPIGFLYAQVMELWQSTISLSKVHHRFVEVTSSSGTGV